MANDDENDRPPSDSDGGTDGLDPSLRDRLADQIERFTDALDAAIANPTSQTLDDLRRAADRLMRATARVLIEAQRLLDSEPDG